MKVSLTGTPSVARFAPIVLRGDPAEAFALAADLGYDGVELHLRRPDDVEPVTVRNLQARYGLGIPTLGTGMAAGEDGLTFSDPDPEVRRQAVARARAHIALAARLQSAVTIGLIRGRWGDAPAERAGRRANMMGALDECCRRVQAGERLESCLASYPAEYREELGRLVPLAGRLSGLRRDPSPQFQARLEQRLLASMDRSRQARRGGWLARLGAMAAGTAWRAATAAMVLVVVLVVGSFGAVQASANSLPDSPLYGVKLAKERVQLALARDAESQVGVRANLIDQRGREIEQALLSQKPRPVLEALANRLTRATENMVTRAIEASEAGNRRPAARAVVILRAAQQRLDNLMAQASPEVRPRLERLERYLGQQERRLLAQAAPGAFRHPREPHQPIAANSASRSASARWAI